MASFNALDDVPCTRNGSTGTIELSYLNDGTAVLACKLPPPPPVDPCGSGSVDDFPSTLDAAYNLGSISGDTLSFERTINGRTCPGDEDWFSILLTENDFATFSTKNLHMGITLHSPSGDAEVCLYSIEGVELTCATGPGPHGITRTIIDQLNVGNSTPFLIRVFPATPGDYVLRIFGG